MGGGWLKKWFGKKPQRDSDLEEVESEQENEQVYGNQFVQEQMLGDVQSEDETPLLGLGDLDGVGGLGFGGDWTLPDVDEAPRNESILTDDDVKREKSGPKTRGVNDVRRIKYNHELGESGSRIGYFKSSENNVRTS